MLRKTKQREAILNVLRHSTSHPTADWIYSEVRQDIPDISLGTVYRNLRLLRECGEALGIDSGSTSSRFNGNPENHYHFRCEKCRRIFDVDEPVDQKINQRVARRTGFKISGHWLEFRGICRDCQKGHRIKQKMDTEVIDVKSRDNSGRTTSNQVRPSPHGPRY